MSAWLIASSSTYPITKNKNKGWERHRGDWGMVNLPVLAPWRWFQAAGGPSRRHRPTMKWGTLMAEYTVKIWDKLQTITVEQKSKSVWVAVGDYRGESIRVQDRSESTALKRWVRSCTLQGQIALSPNSHGVVLD
jgi:hypothetical protein